MRHTHRHADQHIEVLMMTLMMVDGFVYWDLHGVRVGYMDGHCLLNLDGYVLLDGVRDMLDDGVRHNLLNGNGNLGVNWYGDWLVDWNLHGVRLRHSN